MLPAALTPEGDRIPEMADPSCGTEQAPFEAVMVYSDPVDWYRDLQLITDVIMSGQYQLFMPDQPSPGTSFSCTLYSYGLSSMNVW